jgi:hypothetical protein
VNPKSWLGQIMSPNLNKATSEAIKSLQLAEAFLEKIM